MSADLVDRKLAFPPRNFYQLGPSEQREAADHAVAGRREHRTAARTRGAPHRTFKRVIGPVGGQYTFRRDTETPGDRSLELTIIRVAVEKVPALCQSARRGKTFVEVQDQVDVGPRAVDDVGGQLGDDGVGLNQQRLVSHIPPYATICARRVTTMSEPPAALICGTTDGSRENGTAALTANPSPPANGDTVGSIIENPSGTQISHALFSQGIKTWLGNLYATHPPLENRILNILPNWDGEFDYSHPSDTAAVTEQSTASQQPDKEQQLATISALVAAMTTGTIVDQTGRPTPSHLNFAHQLINSLPAEFVSAVNDPFAARAVIYFMMLDTDRNVQNEQLQHLKSASDTGVYEETMKLVRAGYELKKEYRLPIVDLALASLHQLSVNQYRLFRQNLNTLIESDNKITLFEWSISKIVFHHLDPVFIKKTGTSPQNLQLKQAEHACALLLSVLIYSGRQQGIDNNGAFDQARRELGNLDITLLPKTQISLAGLDQSLDRLARLKPLSKPRLLKACAIGITADQNITAEEIEIYRAIAAILDCPMPPLVIT